MLKAPRANTPMPLRSVGCGGFFPVLAGIGVLVSVAMAGAAEPTTLAVADFDFTDTSGEVRDQSAEHDARLKAFGVTLRDGLSRDGKVKVVALTCQAERCTVTVPGVGALTTAARAAGAEYLLVGEVHKMSTLVGWVKLAVLDLNDDRFICDRLLSYRGDSDEAWQRAASFAVRDVGKHCLP